MAVLNSPIADWRTFDVTRWQGAKENEWLPYLLPQNPNSLIYKHAAYAYEVTDAEAPYHVQTALTMLAGLVPSHVVIPFEPPIPINWFGVLVGPNYSSHKTVAIKLAHHLMMQVKPGLWVPMHGSAESLEDFLEKSPQHVFVEQEGGSLLASTDEKPYAKIRQELNSLYDGSPVHRATVEKSRERKSKQQEPQAPVQLNVRASLLYGATEQHFAVHTQTQRDWTNGWMRRQCIVTVTQLGNTRLLPQGLTNEQGRNAVMFHLKRLVDFPHIGMCMGLTPEARAYLHEWTATRIPGTNGKVNSFFKLPKYALGCIRSAEQHALKAAAIYAFDRHTSAFASGLHDDPEQIRQPFWISLEDMVPATMLGELHIASTWRLAQNISQNEHGRVMNEILEKLDELSGAVPLFEVYNAIEMPSRQVDMYLETLLKRHKAYQRGSNLCRLQPPQTNEAELSYLRSTISAGFSPDAPTTQSVYTGTGTIGSLAHSLLNPMITDGGSTGVRARSGY